MGDCDLCGILLLKRPFKNIFINSDSVVAGRHNYALFPETGEEMKGMPGVNQCDRGITGNWVCMQGQTKCVLFSREPG